MGLLPDGELKPPTGTPVAARQPEYSWTLSQAIRTPTLWLLIISLFVGVIAGGALSFNLVAYFTDQGLDPTTAALALGVYALCGAVGSGIWGFVVEKFSERHLLVVMLIVAGGAVFFLLSVQTPVQAIIFGVVYGLAARGENSLIMMMLAQYYGRASYGTISGFITPFQSLGLGLGPLVGSLFYDTTGSYQLVFTAIAFSYGIAAVFMWLAKKPALRAEPAPVAVP
jgi:MFS family permease